VFRDCVQGLCSGIVFRDCVQGLCGTGSAGVRPGRVAPAPRVCAREGVAWSGFLNVCRTAGRKSLPEQRKPAVEIVTA